jgi:hypothetical protein
MRAGCPGGLVSGCPDQDLPEASRPVDEEMLDFIEAAFPESQTDGIKADLAYLCLRAKHCEI